MNPTETFPAIDPKTWNGETAVLCALAAAAVAAGLFSFFAGAFPASFPEPIGELTTPVFITALVLAYTLLMLCLTWGPTRVRTVELGETHLTANLRFHRRSIALADIGRVQTTGAAPAVPPDFAITLFDHDGRKLFRWSHPHEREAFLAAMSRHLRRVSGTMIEIVPLPDGKKRHFNRGMEYVLICMLLCLPFGFLFLSPEASYVRYIFTRGIEAEAVIEFAERDGERSLIEYVYTEPAGGEHRRAIVLDGNGGSLAPGDGVPIRYVAAAPGDSRVLDEPGVMPGTIMNWMALLLVYGGLGLAVRGLLRREPALEPAPSAERPWTAAGNGEAPATGVRRFRPDIVTAWGAPILAAWFAACLAFHYFSGTVTYSFFFVILCWCVLAWSVVASLGAITRLRLDRDALAVSHLWGTRRIRYRDIAALGEETGAEDAAPTRLAIKDASGSLWLALSARWREYPAFKDGLSLRVAAAGDPAPRDISDSAVWIALDAAGTYRKHALGLLWLVLAGIYIAAPPFQNRLTELNLQWRGGWRDGVVTSQYRDAAGGAPRISYAYDAEDRRYSRDIRVNRENWGKYLPGEPVRIAYCPGHPQTSRTWDEIHTGGEPYVAAIASLLVAVAGSIVSAARWRRCRRFIKQI